MKHVLLFLLSIMLTSPGTGIAQSLITTIDGIYVERDTTSYPLKDRTIQDGDMIAFDIPGLGEYLQENRILLSDVCLHVSNIPLPEFPAVVENLETGVVRFEFSERALSSPSRQLLYNLAGRATKQVQLSIKVGDTLLSYSPRATVFFDKVGKWEKVGWILIISFFVFFLLLVLKFKSLVKDNLSNLIDNPSGRSASYSFSKSQLAFWTFIVIASFIYIWALTNDLNSINNTGLILLGISSVTLATSSVIGSKEEMTDKTQKLIQARTSEGNFFRDMLSDNNGLSIHRFQSLVLNVVFGIAFLKSVIFDYNMPDFNETQLLLLGLSNGVYAFMKTTENK